MEKCWISIAFLCKYSGISQKQFVFILMWGFSSNENKPVNIMRKLSCYAVLGTAFWEVWVQGPSGSPCQLWLRSSFSDQLVAAAEFKEWFYVQKQLPETLKSLGEGSCFTISAATFPSVYYSLSFFAPAELTPALPEGEAFRLCLYY